MKFSINLFSVFIGILTIGAITLALNSTTNEYIRDFFIHGDREVLSTITGNFLNDGSVGRVVKVRKDKKIFLEIYRESHLGHSYLVDRVALKPGKDAYFHIGGKVTNLALKDLDGDSNSEIIAPTFDNQLLAQLNIYRYDSSSQRLYRVHSDPSRKSIY